MTPLLNETPIAALATPAGSSAVAVIRVSGQNVLNLLLPQLQRPDGQMARHEDLPPRQLRRMNFLDPENHHSTLDHLLVAFFPAPHSYTGEDVIELQGHGSPIILHRILELLNASGIAPAKPGEFTRRACLHGKLDLTQAEAIATLIQAGSLRSAREAVRQMEGVLSENINNVSNKLLTILAHIEASLDFSDDDVTPLPLPTLLREITEASELLGNLLRNATWGVRLREGLQVAIVGRPNVGKSSLFNRLLGRKRAIVSAIPGTTRDCIEGRIELAGMPITLLDTAGLRSTDEPVEAEGIQLTRERVAQADGVILVWDASQGILPEDRALLQELKDHAVLLVWNKTDQCPPAEEFDVDGFTPIQCSTVTGEGLDRLEKRLTDLLLPLSMDGEGVVIMAVRQKDALMQAVHALSECEAWMLHGKPAEVIAMPLRQSLDALGELVGHITHDDLLDRIFSTFCIGK